jgi:Major Facilitator Superfamily
LTPLMGKLGDQHGKGRLLAISLAIFLAGCIGAAGAWSIWSLIGFRILQGAGGAVFPLSFAIVNDEFPRERSGAAIGAISAVFGAAGGLGLPLAGLLVDHLSWRWLFVVSAAVVAAGLVAVVALVPESPIKTPTRLDLPGAALLTLVLVPFLVALSEGRNWGWTSGRTLGLFVVSAIALAAWILVEQRVEEPLVDLRVLGHRTVAFANATGFCAGFAIFSAYVLVPQLVETPRSVGLDYGFGSSATQAGLFLLPGALIGFFSGPLAGRLGSRYRVQAPARAGDDPGGARDRASRRMAHSGVADRGRDGPRRRRPPAHVRGDGQARRRCSPAGRDGRLHRGEHGHAPRRGRRRQPGGRDRAREQDDRREHGANGLRLLDGVLA